jgi:hypothetical protein
MQIGKTRVIRGIVESDVIVADITPTNPNVFYNTYANYEKLKEGGET